jgi:hypothetical protein
LFTIFSGVHLSRTCLAERSLRRFDAGVDFLALPLIQWNRIDSGHNFAALDGVTIF